MHQVQLNDKLYQEAARRAADAGYASVDEYVTYWLETEFSDEQEDFDHRFTPQVVARLDEISEQMKAGQSVSGEEVTQHLADVRAAWLKDHTG